MTRDAQERRLSWKGRRWAKVLAVLLVACVLLYYLVIRPFVAEPFEIYAEGMLPTLKAGDVSLVNKVSYRFSEPERGDIIVFRSTEGRNEDQIKRVVGLPGDNVEVRDGVLYVNGERQEEPYVNPRRPDSGSYGPTTVPPGHVFVMGDNRANSRDSRFFGPIPFENIEGKVFLTA